MTPSTPVRETQLAERTGTPFTHMIETPVPTQQRTLCRKYSPQSLLRVPTPGTTIPGLPPSLCPLCELVQESQPLVFDSLDHYYNDKKERRTSPEADYGSQWQDPSSIRGQYGNAFRVSYLQATGEVYASRNADSPGTSLLIVLGIHPPDVTNAKPGIYYSSLDNLLTGWPQTSRTPQGLQWIRNKLAATPAFQ